MQIRRTRTARVRAAMILCAVALAAVLAGCGADTGTSSMGSGTLAAKVNGQGIGMGIYNDMTAYYAAVGASQGQQGAGVQAQAQTPGGRGALNDARKNALESLVYTELLREQAAKAGVSVSAQEIETARKGIEGQIAQLRAQSAQQSDTTGLGAVLATLTPDVVQTLAVQQAYQQALTKSQNLKIPAATVKVIIVNTEQEAAALQKDLESGKDFATLAKQKSLDTGTGANGGDLGTRFPGTVTPDFDKAVFAPGAKPQKYLILPLDSSAALFEVGEVKPTPLASAGSAQAQVSALNSWLTDVVRPAAKVETFVSVK